MSTSDGTAKASLRAQLVERRRVMTPAERDSAADAIAAHASSLGPLIGARRVAVYLSMRTEPGTGPLVDALLQRAVEVVAPVVQPEHALAWAVVEQGAVTIGDRGMPEPTGPHLADGLDGCDLLLVPALAVDHSGHRLGRGAGFYDRALADVRAPVCAVVFAHELLPAIPHEPHDVPVQLALTPQGVFRVPE